MKQIDERSLIVVSGPSGSGKDTVVRELMKMDERIKLSVSCTTREIRDGEQEGVDYFFITEEEFKQRIESGDILEYNYYAGHYYGTPVTELAKCLDGTCKVVLVIDVNGGKNVKKLFPGALLIFLEPPSEEELVRRLQSRGTETPEEIFARLEIARNEMAEAEFYDRIVVNREVDEAAAEILELIDSWAGLQDSITDAEVQ